METRLLKDMDFPKIFNRETGEEERFFGETPKKEDEEAEVKVVEKLVVKEVLVEDPWLFKYKKIAELAYELFSSKKLDTKDVSTIDENLDSIIDALFNAIKESKKVVEDVEQEDVDPVVEDKPAKKVAKTKKKTTKSKKVSADK